MSNNQTESGNRENTDRAGAELQRLQEIVTRLRAPDGCPWDKEQTSESLIPYLLEESFEVVEAIENNDPNELRKELGDLALHIVMQAQMAEEQNQFKLEDSLRSINEKLIKRHPHVFGADGDVAQEGGTRESWEKIKKTEGRKSWIDGVPRNMPALIRAHRIQEKASVVGFDWKEVLPALEKFHEEIDELIAEIKINETERAYEEYGDVLFALVNVGRLIGVDSETALRKAIDKFEVRFRAMEAVFVKERRDLEAASLEEMDEVWDAVKHKVKYRR